MVHRLTLLALLILMTACGVNLSGVPSAPPGQAISQVVAPTPYQRAPFSADEVRKLDEGLPKKARQILERADELEVFQIAGGGVSAVVRGDAKAEVLDAFYEGIIRPEPMAGCFKPHHGLRAKSGGDEVEIQICFTCKNFAGKWGSGEAFGRGMGRISGSPATIFDRILAKG
jgi:hypothetical protein